MAKQCSKCGQQTHTLTKKRGSEKWLCFDCYRDIYGEEQQNELLAKRVANLTIALTPFARAYFEAIGNQEMWQGALDRISQGDFEAALNQFGGYEGMRAMERPEEV